MVDILILSDAGILDFSSEHDLIFKWLWLRVVLVISDSPVFDI